MRKISNFVAQLLKWYSQNARDLPWRRTQDPYGVYVSEIMLQQTQVRTVIPYWERWMQQLPTIKAAAQAAPARIHKLWEGLGYYTRVRNLQLAAQTIVREHGGGFPENFDQVLALPGIGRYTAGAICSIAFNQPKPILDGNKDALPGMERPDPDFWHFRESEGEGHQRPTLATGGGVSHGGTPNFGPQVSALFRPQPGFDGAGRAGLHPAPAAM